MAQIIKHTFDDNDDNNHDHHRHNSTIRKTYTFSIKFFHYISLSLLLLLLLLLIDFAIDCSASKVDDDKFYLDPDRLSPQSMPYFGDNEDHYTTDTLSSAGFDYEQKVRKARAFVDVLASKSSFGAGETPLSIGSLNAFYALRDTQQRQQQQQSDLGLGLIGPYSVAFDERFRWMQPFEFYECDHAAMAVATDRETS